MGRVKDQYFDEIARNTIDEQYKQRERDAMAALYDNFIPLTDDLLEKLEAQGERQAQWRMKHKI